MGFPDPADPVSALTRADGSTEPHSHDHGRVIEFAANPKYHGAAGDSSATGGGQDDTAYIQAAIDEALGGTMSSAIPTPARRGADGVGRVYVPAGYYRITSPLIARSLRGLVFQGAGIDSTVFVVDGSFDQAIQFYGAAHMHVGGFSIMGANGYGGDGTVLYGFSWDWVSGQADSSSSRSVFEDIWVRDLTFAYGVGVGVDSANYDVSNGMFRHVNVNGDRVIGDPDPFLYQAAFEVGSGTNGNILNHDFQDCSHEGVKTCYYIDDVNRTAITGGQATHCDEYLFRRGPGIVAVRDVRVEETPVLARSLGGASWTSDLILDNIHWDPGSNGDDDGHFIQWNDSGTISIRGMHTRIPSNNSLQQLIYCGNGAGHPIFIRGEGLSIGGLERVEDFVSTSNVNADVYVDLFGLQGIQDDGAITENFPAQFFGINSAEARINPHSIRLGTSGGPTVTQGLGSPEGALTAPKGSVFASRNAGFFFKSTGTSDTGWVKMSSTTATGPYIPSGTTATNLLCWYNAGDIDGLSDGDPLSSWPDSTGQCLPLTQTDASSMPTYETGVVNSEPVVRFTSGSEQLYALSHEAAVALAGSDLPMTVFIVFKRASNRVTVETPVYFAGVAQPFANHYPLRISGTNNDVGVQREDNSATAVSASSSAGGDTNWNVWCQKFTGTAVTMYSGITGITGASLNVGATTLSTLLVGNPCIGDLAEFLVYDSALADTPRQEIQTYLGTKYNITIS